MKNLFTRLMLVAVAAMGFVACQEGYEDVTIAPEASEVVMTITADADNTRTVLDEANNMVQWSDGDALKVIENSKNYRTTTNTVITNGKAQFTVAFEEDTTSESFTYNAFYPATAVSEDDADKVNNAKVKVIVKDAQNPTATSFDPTADILVSKQIVTDTQPTELSMQFARLVALGKMTLTNLPASSTISKVVFSVEGTDENNATKIAGRNYVDATTGVVSEYGYYGKTNTITLNYNEPISTPDIYFTCNPFVLVEGEKFTVKVTCKDYIYTREVEIPAGRSLSFKQGNLNTFSVDMTSAIREDNFVFPDGEYAVLAYKNGKYYALSCTNANNSTRLDSIDDVTYSGEGEFTTDNANLKWTIKYTEGAGYTFMGNNGQYVAWYQTDDDKDNFARTQDDKYYLDIAKDGNTGRYVVISKEDATRKLQRNSSAQYFAFYTSNQWGSLCIVPITIKVDTTPSITIDTTPVSFDYNANEGTIAATLKNLEISDVTITSSAGWLTATLTEDGLNYKATANEGEERTATLTLSAEEINGIVITFTQAAKPAEVAGTWTLVTDASSLAVDDQVVIVAVDYNYALSTTQNNNNRGQIDVTKSGTTVTINEKVQILTLKEGTVDGTFAFYTGSGYLYAASSSSNNLKTQTTNNANSSWTITIADGAATIKAQGANTRNWLRYNNSSSIFSCYGSGQNDVAIYRLGGEPDTTPRFTVTTTDELSIGADGGEIQFTVTTYNGAVVTAESSDTTWLTIDNTFKATVKANETAEARSATITFSAEGCDDIVVTVSQEGKPAEGETISATLSFADDTYRTECDSEHQIWEQNGIIFKNYKNDTTTNVAPYYNPVRLYKGSEVVIVPPGYGSQTQIVFDCNNASYAEVLEDSITVGTVSRSGDKVTVTFTGLSNTGTYTIDELSGQVRLDSLTIYTIYNL